MRLVCCVFAVLAIVACSGANGHSERTANRKTKSGAQSKGLLIEGPIIRNSAQLLAWLKTTKRQGQRTRRVIRLPIVVRWQPRFPVVVQRKKQIKAWRLEAFIGNLSSLNNPQTIAVKLDDTALGIRIADRVRMQCPVPAQTCTLWLEGYWGPLISAAPATSSKPVFSVLQVYGPVLPNNEPLRAYVRGR